MGALRLSVWGKNLTDEEYVIYRVPLTGVGAVRVFGASRTYGIDLNNEFQAALFIQGRIIPQDTARATA